MTSPDASHPIDLGSRLPALDGLRGLALLGMLAWHAELEWVRGGFARMTIFFVLAGFLATRSILRSQRNTPNRRAFLTFWGRRARRLLPITILGLAWAVAVTMWIGGSHARERLTGDTVAALASFTNWRLILDEQPYGAMFETRSAFQHYWSLSLEEQSFLLLPFLLGAAYLLARRNSDAMLVVLGIFAVCFGLLPLVVEMSPDAAYYGTHVRLGEFLVGAVLAGLLLRFEGTRPPTRVARAIGVAGVVGLVSLLATMALIDRETSWIYQGGMLAFAIPTAAIIAAVCLARPGVTAALGIAPLAALGRWAFSIYVLHWPLFLLLAELFPTTGETTLVILQLTSAIAAGAVVHHLVERPLMPGATIEPAPRRSWPSALPTPAQLLDRWPVPALALGVAVLIGVTLVLPEGEEAIDFEAAAGANQDDTASPRPDGAPTVALFGGSNAFMLTAGQYAWTEANGNVGFANGDTTPRCGLTAVGQALTTNMLGGNPRLEDPPPECSAPASRWAGVIERRDIDVAVVVASRVDLGEWQLPDGDEVVSIEHPSFRDHLREILDQFTSQALDAGATTLVFTTHLPPHPSQPPDVAGTIADRSAHFSELLLEMADGRAEIDVVDLAPWAESLDPAEFERLMADTVHPNAEGSRRIWLEVIGPHLEQMLSLQESAS